MAKQQNKETLGDITTKYETYKELTKNLKAQLKVLESTINGIKDENLYNFYSKQIDMLKTQINDALKLRNRYSCRRYKLETNYYEKMRKSREEKNKIAKTENMISSKTEAILVQIDKPDFLIKYEMLEKVYNILGIKIGDIFRTNFISKNVESNCWVKATREGLIDIATGYYFHTLLGHLIGNPRVKITERK